MEPFLRRVRPSGLLLASDFDGTLSEVVEDPAAARPLPESLAALGRLCPVLRAVAVISGRGTHDLERLLPLEGVLKLGDYGLGHPTAAERSALATFNLDAAALAADRPKVRLEAKSGSTSIHFRLDPSAGPDLLALVEPSARRQGLAASLGRMVVEVRPPRGDKGKALATLVDQLRPAAVIFAGDDQNDRPAFEAVGAAGIPHLAVGISSPEASPGLFAVCDLVLPGPQEFSRFLSRLADWAAPPGPGRPGSGE